MKASSHRACRRDASQPGLRRRIAWIVVATAVVAFVLAVALLPRAYEPTAADLRGVTQPREGYEWRTATFGGLILESLHSQPIEATLDGRDLPLGGDVTIRRAMMRRSVPAFWPHLVLLEFPDWESWNGLAGRLAWYEVSLETGRVSRVIISEKPR
jgi:hypothetical protein